MLGLRVKLPGRKILGGPWPMASANAGAPNFDAGWKFPAATCIYG